MQFMGESVLLESLSMEISFYMHTQTQRNKL